MLQVSRNNLEFGQLKNALINTYLPVNRGGVGGGGKFVFAFAHQTPLVP